MVSKAEADHEVGYLLRPPLRHLVDVLAPVLSSQTRVRVTKSKSSIFAIAALNELHDQR